MSLCYLHGFNEKKDQNQHKVTNTVGGEACIARRHAICQATGNPPIEQVPLITALKGRLWLWQRRWQPEHRPWQQQSRILRRIGLYIRMRQCREISLPRCYQNLESRK